MTLTIDSLTERDIAKTIDHSLLRPELDDTSSHRWATWAEFADLCHDQFWWPLADAVLSPRGG